MEGGQLQLPGRWYYAPLGTGCWQTKLDINALSVASMPLARAWSFSGHWRCCGSTDKQADTKSPLEVGQGRAQQVKAAL